MFGEKEDCRGYIVGHPNMGLPYMFQMMNEARIATGLMATGGEERVTMETRAEHLS